ncbi:MAG: RibD family protein [Rubrobacter sp.]|jgi:riboflavin-specific deaminase-like protein|nr:RibD family protein [Rubrobacter sp.]
MVSSLDGKTAVDGKASPIGSETDRLVMRSLRSKADAVMTGAGTLRAEKLDLRSPRAGSLAVVISTSGDFPLENIVHGSPEDLLVFTTTAVLPGRVREISRRARVEDVLPPDRPDEHLHLLLKSLKDSYGISTLLVEGGPGLNYSLISGGHVDEVFTTIAPKLLGGSPERVPGIIHGPQLPPDTTSQLTLASVYTAEDELYLRYSVRNTSE